MKLPVRGTGMFVVILLFVAGAGVRGANETPKQTEIPLNRDVPRHRDINARAQQGNVDLIFIGDSITQGWETNGAEVWKKRFEPRHALNAGIGGDRTQHVLWRLDNGNVDNISPKLAVLMIGTNNFGDDPAEDIALGIKAIVDKLGGKLPTTKVLLLGVFPRGEKPDDLLRAKNVYVNAIIKKLHDGKRVYYLDINHRLLKADGEQDRDIMPDLVHLSPKGYEIWADALEPKVSELLEENVPFPELPKTAGKIDKDASQVFKATASGLRYRILRKGDGAAPNATDTVTVDYKGWLDDGTAFDSSYDRGEAIKFPLNAVIKGWTEGMQLVSIGGMIELEIPFDLAYGAAGRPPQIPPKATLHFLVELLEVN
jgi:beta-glucosidase